MGTLGNPGNQPNNIIFDQKAKNISFPLQILKDAMFHVTAKNVKPNHHTSIFKKQIQNLLNTAFKKSRKLSFTHVFCYESIQKMTYLLNVYISSKFPNMSKISMSSLG